MENPIILRPQPLSPCTNGRRSTDSSSPEFEFWMSRNPSFPQPDLLSADQLIVDGVLLPLHLLRHTDSEPEPDPDPQITSTSSSSSSKRWTDIFKHKITNEEKSEKVDKSKKKDRKVGNSAELNINLWPFSRSRSAGNVGNKARILNGSGNTRKVSSAPCSRSNSSGESKLRKLPSSPSRGGIHLSRSSPVWQVRRSKLGGSEIKAKVENVDVPVCIGYRQHLSCRNDENGGVAGSSGSGRSEVVEAGDGGRSSNNNLFNLRSLFTKKVH